MRGDLFFNEFDGEQLEISISLSTELKVLLARFLAFVCRISEHLEALEELQTRRPCCRRGPATSLWNDARHLK